MSAEEGFGFIFSSINVCAMYKLFSSVYLAKYFKYFPEKDVESIHKSLSCEILDDEYKSCLTRLGYKPGKLKDLSQWLEFVRYVTYRVNRHSPKKELLLMPKQSALYFHIQRTSYVCHLAFQSPLNSNSEINKVEDYGWQKNQTGSLEIKWDAEVSGTLPAKQIVKGEKGCGCSKGTCNPKSKKQCVNCFWMCKPCGIKCKCVASACTNPHNTGVGCIRCKPNLVVSNVIAPEPSNVKIEINYDEECLNDSTEEVEINSSDDESDYDQSTDDYVGRPLLPSYESDDGLIYDNQVEAYDIESCDIDIE